MPGLVIEFGKKKKSSLADEIASKIPSPSKLRKSASMSDESEDDGSGNAAAEAAFDAFCEAVKRGDSKAGVKAFKLLDSLTEEDEDQEEVDEEENDEE